MLNPDTLDYLQELQTHHRRFKDSFFERTADRRQQLLLAFKESRNGLLDEIYGRIAQVRTQSPLLQEVWTKFRLYAERSDWSFVDMLVLAVCSPADVREIASRVAPYALVYHALRMLDDVLDGHQTYKGGTPTLLGELSADSGAAHLALAANLLPAMLIMATTHAELPADDWRLIEQTLTGMLHEAFPGACTHDAYRRIAMAKMGAYGLFQYRPVITTFASADREPVTQFLSHSFFISQLVNDFQDQLDDGLRSQPNFWLLENGGDDAMPQFLAEIRKLSRTCVLLPEAVRPYGHARLTDLLAYFLQVDRARDQSRDHRAVQAS